MPNPAEMHQDPEFRAADFQASSVYTALAKPVAERTIALALLIAMLPVLLVLAFVLLFVNRGRVFFRQSRVGLYGQPFTIIKLRSSARHSVPGPNAHYTAFGRWMRRHHLDELPQLLCVLSGKMSLVGPRPLLTADLPPHVLPAGWRHAVRPGLTGLVQVSGGKALPWQRRFVLDRQYVAAASPATDGLILLATVAVVFGIGVPPRFAPRAISRAAWVNQRAA